MLIEGNDPQQEMDDTALVHTGLWNTVDGMHTAASAGAEASCTFTGNQVRVLGRAASTGGFADVYSTDFAARADRLLAAGEESGPTGPLLQNGT